MRVLIVEDKVRMANLLQRAVERAGYLVVVAHDGEAALHLATNYRLDAVILDVMLPKMNGYAVLEQLRRSDNKVPTILLTARDSNQDIVHGLDLGADDYLTKPFDLNVLLARLRALTRRAPDLHPRILRVGALVLRNDTRRVESGERAIALTPTEFALLEVLMQRAGHVVSKDTLGEIGWKMDTEFSESTLYVFIRSLRTKIHSEPPTATLQTVRGVGYMLKVMNS